MRRSNLCYWLYNGLLLLLSPLIMVYLAQRYLSGKSRVGWRERWGNLPSELRSRPDGRPRIWVHAVSAGEVVAAVPILRELRQRWPQYELLLSVMTPAGREIAEQQGARWVDGLLFFPFDLPWVARRVVRALRPRVFVSLESELWPNVLHELKRQGAATVMVNGRLSEKNYRRAARFGRIFFAWMLGNMDRLLVQSPQDAERIRKLSGRSLEPGRIEVIGNSKFDQELAPLSPAQVMALRRDLHLPLDAPVFVAGSTRSAEEETEVITAYQQMRAAIPELCLLVAPRQIERAGELEIALRNAGLQPVRRTALRERESSEALVRQLILDTLGELANVYAVAAIAFVGNSFPPVVKGGGQNLLQPLAHGKPTLFGPLTATIRSEVALAQEAGVGFCVNDGQELAAVGIRLLRDEAERQRIEARALELIAANRGVSARYAAAVEALAS